jgi:putative spermidine/putrescine transport system permease protein
MKPVGTPTRPSLTPPSRTLPGHRPPARWSPWRWVLLAALFASTVVPFAILLLQSIGSSWRWPELLPAGYTLDGWRAAARGALGEAALTSVLLAVGTAIMATAFGLPIGRALARLAGRGRHAAAALVFLPVAAPPIALAAGLQIAALWLGVGGTSIGVWMAHVVPATGYAALLFLGVFSTRSVDDEEAARSLGASPWQLWRRVVIPSLRTPITESLAICFLISWAQVALTLVVGGGAVRALPVEVLLLVRAGQEREAAVGALLLVIPAVAALAALRAGARRTDALPA